MKYAKMTASERDQLGQLERLVADGLTSFAAVGTALQEIRDKKLYRAYGTFEEYLAQRWNLSRFYAHRLIDAAGVIHDLLPIGNKLPANEAQARALTHLSPDDRREVWAQATAPGAPAPTASRLQELAAKLPAFEDLSPAEQAEEVAANERAILSRRSTGDSSPARQVGGEGRKDRLAAARRLLERARRVIEGFGDEAEQALAHLDRVTAALDELPPA